MPSAADYVRSLRMMLEGIAQQEGELKAPEQTLFRDEILAFANELKTETPAKELTILIDGAIESFRKYSGSAAARISAHLNELKATMRALTETVTFLAESRSSVVHQLTFIERQLEQASELEDIRLLRPKLAACLEMVREETARLQNESAANSELVRSGLGVAPQHTESPRRVGSLDPVTGLPGRQVAQRLIEDKVNAGKESVVALFIPDRLEAINRHHGRNAGDEVLLRLAQHLSKSIQPPATLCRWSGPAFLALVEAQDKSAAVSRSWNSVAAKAIELTLQLDRRSVMVSVSLSCVTKTVTGSTSVAAICDDFDKAIGQR
jgi:diguanylate cyclase (GGDEF)-like protein